jgi:hypothetical protein
VDGPATGLCAGRLLLLLLHTNVHIYTVKRKKGKREREREREKRGPQTGDASTVAADTHALTR